MFRLAQAVLLVFLSCLPVAAEEWNCDFTVQFSADKSSGGSGKILVNGGELTWLLPPAPGAIPPRWTPFHYRVLENNAVGLVAADAGAKLDERLGPVVGVNIIALRKADGMFRMGSVSSEGTRDTLAGTCKKN